MKNLIPTLLLVVLLFTACTSDESPAEAGGDSAVQTAVADDTAVAAAESDADKDAPASAAQPAAEARSGTHYAINGAYTVDDPQASAIARALDGTANLIINVRTHEEGSFAETIIYLENVPATAGDYELSRLSAADPAPGEVRAGVDIRDEEIGGVYPYVQFGDNTSGTLTITAVADGRISGSFTFNANDDAQSVTVDGAFANISLP